MLQQSLAVFLVLALLLAALWLLRRKGLPSYGFLAGSKWLYPRDTEKRLRLLERLVLTPQHSLHLVQIGDQRVLIATSPTGCQPVEPILLQNADQAAPASLKNGASC